MTRRCAHCHGGMTGRRRDARYCSRRHKEQAHKGRDPRNLARLLAYREARP